MSTDMQAIFKSTIKYLTVITISFSAGYIYSMKKEQENYLYIANGWFSLSMIDDVSTLNALQAGDVDAAIKQLNANVYGGLVGWDSTGLITKLLDVEPIDSPHVQDLNSALRLAAEYSATYHEPDIAKSYNDILSKYHTHNNSKQQGPAAGMR
jgi:hypothetical protein